MPVTDFTDPLPPSIYVDPTDLDVLGTSPFPGGSRASTQPVTFDLRDCLLSRSNYTVAPVKFRLANQAPGCAIRGGFVYHHDRVRNTDGTWRLYTWAEMHKNYGIAIESRDVTVIGTHIDSVGDGIAFAIGNYSRVVSCFIDRVRDDAIQNDAKYSSLTDDCLIRSHNVAFSAQSGFKNTTSGRVWRIQNTLVRLEPHIESYKPWKYNNPVRIESDNEPAGWRATWQPVMPQGKHSGFFKFGSPDAPPVVLKDCFFRADQPASYGGSLRPPAGATGDNVVLIGTDAWDPADVQAWFDSDIANVWLGDEDDWTNAEAHWLSTHPELVDA
jgi:hypothetical protein